MVHLVINRVPQIYELTTSAPTPLAQSLADLIVNPIIFFSNYSEASNL